MYKVLIESENYFFCLGVKYILERLTENEVTVSQTTRYKKTNAEEYDFYFFGIKPGDDKVCHTRVLDIPADKPIFFITKRKGIMKHVSKNKCIERGVMLHYEMSVSKIESLIAYNLKQPRKRISCSNCTKPSLTQQEMTVLRLYLFGLDVASASSALNLSQKAVYLHLRNIKIKLGVTGRKEFAFLLKDLTLI